MSLDTNWANEIRGNWLELKLKLIVIDLTLCVNRAQVVLSLFDVQQPGVQGVCSFQHYGDPLQPMSASLLSVIVNSESPDTLDKHVSGGLHGSSLETIIGSMWRQSRAARASIKHGCLWHEVPCSITLLFMTRSSLLYNTAVHDTKIPALWHCCLWHEVPCSITCSLWHEVPCSITLLFMTRSSLLYIIVLYDTKFPAL